MTRAVLAAVPVAAGVGLWFTPAVWQTVAVLAFVWWVAWLTGHTARPALARFATVTALASAAAVLWVAARILLAGVPWWALPAALAVPAVLWWHAIAVHTPHPSHDEDEEPEPGPEPGRRPYVIVDRTPHPEPPVVTQPRVARLTSAPTLVDFDTDDHDYTGTPNDPALDLAARVADAWDGEATVMHLDELAARMGVEKDLLRLDLDEAGIPVDAKARKKRNGVSTPKAGVRRDAFDGWREALSTS